MNEVQRLKKISPDATLDQIVSADQKAGELLSSIGLEPSNHRKETLRSVCQQRQWSEEEVLRWIKKNRSKDHSEKKEPSEELDFEEEISRWCDHIEEVYHTQILDLLEDISNDFPRIHQIHGNQYVWIKEMQWPLDTLNDKLQYYIQFEAGKFFRLVNNLTNPNRELLDGTIQKIEKGLEIIEDDHNEILRLIHTLKEKGRGFENPPLACSSYRIFNYRLKSLCEMLTKQFEIEQEKLFPLVHRRMKAL